MRTNPIVPTMKTAYELAMERLNKKSPSVKLNEDQKKEIAELESKCKARIAEKEIHFKEQIHQATAKGDFAKIQELEKQLVEERNKLKDDLESRKAAIHQAGQ